MLLCGVYHSDYTWSIFLSAVHPMREWKLDEMLLMCGVAYPNYSGGGMEFSIKRMDEAGADVSPGVNN